MKFAFRTRVETREGLRAGSVERFSPDSGVPEAPRFNPVLILITGLPCVKG